MDEDQARRVPRPHVAAAVILLTLAVLAASAVLVLPRVDPGSDVPGRSATAPPSAAPGSPATPAPPATGTDAGTPSTAAITERLMAPVTVSRVTSGTPLLTTSYAAAPGVARLVSARVVSNQPADRPPARTGVQLSIVCATDGAGERRSVSIENVQRGSTVTQEPRMLYTAPRWGRVTCTLSALPFYGEGGGASVGSRVYVLSGARLVVSTTLPAWAKEVTWDHPRAAGYVSELVEPGGRFDANPALDVAVPAGVRRVEVQADHKVTNCWFRGGSSDVTTLETPVTGDAGSSPTRRDLCPSPNPRSDGVEVGLYTRVTRLAPDGTPCVRPTVTRQTRWVSGPAHHARLNTTTQVELPPVAGCSDVLRVRTWVVNEVPPAGSPMPLVVHAPGERVAVLPGDVEP